MLCRILQQIWLQYRKIFVSNVQSWKKNKTKQNKKNIRRKTKQNKQTKEKKILKNVFVSVLTVLLTIIVELCGYPGSFFTVPTDYVEVCKQVERNLNKELKAEQCQDAEVNIGQLDCEGLVGEFRCWV